MSEVRRAASGDFVEVAELADGDYVGQPLRWDGSAWGPLPDGQALVFALLEALAELTIAAATNLSLHAPDGTLDLITDDFVLETSDPTTFVHLNPGAGLAGQGVVVNLIDAAGVSFLELDSGLARLEHSGAAVQCDDAGVSLAASAIGFFSASPVARPTITGATTQQQVDSLVSALVALGLVTDGR